jgi:hypothetical protein
MYSCLLCVCVCVFIPVCLCVFVHTFWIVAINFIVNFISFLLLDKLSPLVVGDFERHVQEMHSNDNHGFSIEFTVKTYLI